MDKICLVLTSCLLLFGCGNAYKLEENITTYQQRMAKILSVEPISLKKVVLPPYPALHLLEQNIAEQTIKLFEFYQLKHCHLYTMVAERNTTLGKLHSPSTRYVYEKALLNALEECAEQTADAQLREKLQGWFEIKYSGITVKWADLIQLSGEMKQGLSSNTGLINGSITDGLGQTKEALEYLLALEKRENLNAEELEKHLKNFSDTPLPAKLWLSQLVLSTHLEQLNTWLYKHAGQINCSTRQQQEMAEYLRNVFQLFFIEKIQPVASQINHYHYQLSPTFSRLVNHPSLSKSYTEYIQTQHFDEFSRYKIAMQTHLIFWQVLFKSCNMQPGK